MNQNPINPFTKWSCYLACLEWYMNKFTQQEMLNIFKDYFPKWNKEPGTCSRGDIINLLEFHNIRPRKFIHTNNHHEIVSELEDPNGKMIFVLTRKPTNHALILQVVISLEPLSEEIRVMQPDFPVARYQNYKIQELLNKYDSDFLIVYVP
jgi:hypothetical protein